MTVFSDADSVIFANDDMGMDAVYTPLQGDIASVRVIFRESREYLDAQAMTSRYLSTMAFQKSQVDPKRGDKVTLGSNDYVIGKPVEGTDDGLVIEYWVHRAGFG